MNFEEFEKKIWEKGYGVAAMNHYTVSGKRFTYCVVLSRNKQRAFQAEAEKSEEVFENIFSQITNYEKNKEKSVTKPVITSSRRTYWHSPSIKPQSKI